MKKKKGDDWFPFWIDKWLLGSTRDELTIEQCAIWVDFLALSYKDEGYIRANEGIPYPIQRLAGLLNRPAKLIQATIDRCLEPKINKLRLEPDGTLYVVSHPIYELSKRHKRRLSTEGCPENGHHVQKTDAKRRLEERRLEKRREEKKGLPHLRIKFNFKEKKWRGITDEDLEHWKKTFPDVDLEYHIFTKMVRWIILNPKKGRKKNYVRFINNWLSDEQEKFDLKNAGKHRDEKRTEEWLKEKD